MAGAVNGEADKTTKSASLPGESVPFSPRDPVAVGAPLVYAATCGGVRRATGRSELAASVTPAARKLAAR